MSTNRKPHAPLSGATSKNSAKAPTTQQPQLTPAREEVARLLGELLAERWVARLRVDTRVETHEESALA